MRLAEHVAHTTNVDAMLAGMTHAQFDEWCAKDLVEPIGQEKLCVTIARLGVYLGVMFGVDFQEADFMPWLPRRQDRDTGDDTLTPRQAAAAIGSQIAIAAATGAK